MFKQHGSCPTTRTGTTGPAPILAPVVLVVVLGFAVPARAAGPERVVRSSHDKINQLLRKEKAGSGSRTQLETRMKKIINQFLDFKTLARAALASHYPALTEAQRSEYVSLFRQLIEASYIRRLRGQLNYKVVYGKTKRSGATAKVFTTVEVVKRGRKSETKIVYILSRTSGRWMVHDVVTNDVSLARNYRRSFGRIMRRRGYTGLIAKMRRKIKQLNL